MNNNVNDPFRLTRKLRLTRKHIKDYFVDAPLLLPMNDYDSIIRYNFSVDPIYNKFMNEGFTKDNLVIYLLEDNDNKFFFYLVNCVVFLYKIDDISLRSFWITDYSRKTIMFRQYDNGIVWKDDNHGKIVASIIIAPLITYLSKVIDDSVDSFDEQTNKDLYIKRNILQKKLNNPKMIDKVMMSILPYFCTNVLVRHNTLTGKFEYIHS